MNAPDKETPLRPESFRRGFLLLLVAAVTGVFLWMIRGLLGALFFAALFAALLNPLHGRLTALLKGRARLAAGLSILVFVLGVFLPVVGFGGLVARQAVLVTESVKPWVQEHLGDREDINDRLRRLPGYKYVAPYREAVAQKIDTAVSRLGNGVFRAASALTAGTLLFLVNFAIMLYAMFFFFIDGPTVLERILYYMPLQNKDEKRLLDGFRSMARATMKGLVVIGAVQGGLAGLALWAAGIPSALFWGTVMAVLSVVPNVGSALVWAPACVYLFLQGKTLAGTLTFLWCAVVVGSADNLLRPVLVGKDTQVHELLVLVSTIGGLSLWGLEGFILGPVFALFFLTVWDIYGATFKDVLPKPPAA
jgi:predicted PurR-regulated permease PerM